MFKVVAFRFVSSRVMSCMASAFVVVHCHNNEFDYPVDPFVCAHAQCCTRNGAVLQA